MKLVVESKEDWSDQDIEYFLRTISKEIMDGKTSGHIHYEQTEGIDWKVEGVCR